MEKESSKVVCKLPNFDEALFSKINELLNITLNEINKNSKVTNFDLLTAFIQVSLLKLYEVSIEQKIKKVEIDSLINELLENNKCLVKSFYDYLENEENEENATKH